MSDATYIELPPQPRKSRSFMRSWRGAVLLLFLLAAVLAGCFSWWLSEGKLSSVYGRVDTVVYTVEPQQSGRIAEIMAYQGMEVQTGQPLAKVDAESASVSAQDIPEAPLDPDHETERSILARLQQARSVEERYQRIHQERITEHVRAQLYLRSLEGGDPLIRENARKMEEAALTRAEMARADFEKANRARALMEAELGRVRADLARRKTRGIRSGQTSRKEAQPAPLPPPEVLYAPVNGRIMDIAARPGQLVQRGQPVFMILPANDAGTWIQAWFPVSAQKMLKLDQKASIKSGDMHFTGRVTAISADAQYLPGSSSGNLYLPVRIQPENQQEFAKLSPGSSVDCQIQTRYVVDENIF